MNSDGHLPEELLRDLDEVRADEGLVKSALAPVRREAMSEEALGRMPRESAPETMLRRTMNWVRMESLHPSPLARSFNRWAIAGALGITAAVLIWRLPVSDEVLDPTNARAQVAAVVVQNASAGARLFRSGVSQEIASGTALAPSDVVVTEAGERVQLAIGGSTELTVDARSRVRFSAARSDAAHFDILQGRTEGRVDAVHLAIGAGPIDIKVLSGAVGVLRNVNDELAVASLTNAVIENAGQRHSLRADEVVRVGAPGVVAATDEVELSLTQDAPIRRGEGTVVLRGQTSPNVTLVIDDRSVPLGKSGEFLLTLTINEEVREVEAIARDAAGRQHRKALALVRTSSSMKWKGR